jgi:hypothetical protein
MNASPLIVASLHCFYLQLLLKCQSIVKYITPFSSLTNHGFYQAIWGTFFHPPGECRDEADDFKRGAWWDLVGRNSSQFW